jgi:polysaccharide biosynthesis protein PslH
MKILLLSTWFPYPPNQGSKIRAYYLIRALAATHEVVLVTFADVAIQPQWLAHMLEICAHVHVIDRGPFYQDRLRTVQGWLSLKPRSVIAIYSKKMSKHVKQIASDWQPDCVLALTFVMAAYALELRSLLPKVRLVLDVDNLLTRMLREAHCAATQLNKRARSWLAWWKFRRYEAGLCQSFDLSLVVSDQDRRELLEMTSVQLPSGQSRRMASAVTVVPNGVDIAHNTPTSVSPQPNTLVFSGALTYSANYDAMDYFLQDIFPKVQASVPDVHLSVTGSTKNVQIDRLAIDEHVSLTGFLDDVRPVVANSWASVAPLRLGGGTRLKILESMALGTPVISTPKGAEGLNVTDGKDILLANDAKEFAQHVIDVVRSPEKRAALSSSARKLVEDQYDWIAIGQTLRHCIEALCAPTAKKV